MRSLAVLSVVLFLAYACAQSTNLSSVNTFGIDMIELDSPAWLTKIQKSHVDHQLLVFGESTQRAVAGSPTGSPFTALPVLPYWNNFPFEMLDVETIPFYNQTANTTTPWTIGVTDFTADQASTFINFNSPYLPLVYVKPSPAASTGFVQYVQTPVDQITGVNWSGTMFSALRVYWQNYSDVQVYYAGFETHVDPDVGLLTTFGVFRTHLDIATPVSGLTQTRFTFDDSTEASACYTGQFTSFSATYKPFVHVLPYFGPLNITMIVVADPNTRTIYSGYFDDSANGGWKPVYSYTINIKFSDLVSTALSYQTGKLYVGVAQSGLNTNGSIFVVDLNQAVTTQYQLPTGANNPKALAIDDRNSVLYIGLNGNSEVLRFDCNANLVTGYQRLPEWLHRSWDATEFPDHIYFVTNEEHSKVFRVNKVDFCPNRCPYNGYCSNGACTCGQGYTHVQGHCTLTQLVKETTLEKRVHGGEVALGILFAFAVIAAAAGWYLWYRGRHGAYQSV